MSRYQLHYQSFTQYFCIFVHIAGGANGAGGLLGNLAGVGGLLGSE